MRPAAALSLIFAVSASRTPRQLSASSIVPLACRFCPGLPVTRNRGPSAPPMRHQPVVLAAIFKSRPLPARRSATAPRRLICGVPPPPAVMSIADSPGAAIDPAMRAAMRKRPNAGGIELRRGQLAVRAVSIGQRERLQFQSFDFERLEPCGHFRLRFAHYPVAVALCIGLEENARAAHRDVLDAQPAQEQGGQVDGRAHPVRLRQPGLRAPRGIAETQLPQHQRRVRQQLDLQLTEFQFAPGVSLDRCGERQRKRAGRRSESPLRLRQMPQRAIRRPPPRGA